MTTDVTSITQQAALNAHYASDFNAPNEAFNSSKRIEDIEQKVFDNNLFTVFDVSREPLGTVLTLKCFNDDSVSFACVFQ